MGDATIDGYVWVMLLYMGCMGDATIHGDVWVILLYMWMYG